MCCLGSPATQFGLLQSQIAHTQAVFRGFTSPFIVPLQFSAFTFNFTDRLRPGQFRGFFQRLKDERTARLTEPKPNITAYVS